jgi:hypothetical protein
MKRLLTSLALFSLVGAASAQLIVPPSSPKTFSGYDGQPADQTGTLSSGVQGLLQATEFGAVSFTFLGQESANFDQFTFTVGNQTLTDASAVGTTISGLTNAGALDFSFTDVDTGHTFTNGTLASVYVADVTTKGLGHYAYVIGFNDDGSSDGDFDDFVVGVNFVANPVPEPETYALMLAGLGAVGFMARRRQRSV